MNMSTLPASLLTAENLTTVGVALCSRTRWGAGPKWSDLTGDAAVLGDCLLIATKGKWPVYPRTPQAKNGTDLAHWFLKLCPSDRPYQVGFNENASYVIWPDLGVYALQPHACSYSVPKELEYCCGVLYILNRYGALPACPIT